MMHTPCRCLSLLCRVAILCIGLIVWPTSGLAEPSSVQDPYLWYADIDVESWSITEMSDGIPRVRYGDHLQDNPVTVEQWGLAHYSQGDTATALKAAEWLRQQQRPDGTWVYTFDYPMPFASSTLHKPWVSALAQGQGISLFLRAWEITGDVAYIDAADLALKPFSVPVEQGGVLRIWQGMPFFEEYPQPGQPTLVLNGFLYALIGVREFAVATGDTTAGELWSNGEATAATLLPEYSMNDSQSTYSLAHLSGGPPPTPVSDDYKDAHVKLLREFFRLTGRQIYSDTADRWERGPSRPAWQQPAEALGLAVIGLMAVAIALRRRYSRRQQRGLSAKAAV